MKAGIVVHSRTGNTLSVAERLKEKLAAAGHMVSIERLTPDDEMQNDPGKVRIIKLPDLSPYDAVVLAAPVHGFSASAVMKAYLAQMPPLDGKKVACFVTKALPFDFTGGNQAVSAMKRAAESRGGTVVGTGIVKWSGEGREKRIADLVERLGKAF